MSDNKLLIIIFAAVIILVGGGVVWAAKSKGSPEVEVNVAAKAEVTETEYDWGNISINGDKAEKTFTINNEGEAPLKLYDVQTSCMCTTAQVIAGGKASPEFGMHSQSSYMAEVAPGEAAQLKVVFDQAFHGPSGVGPVSREVIVSTNDPAHPKLSFSLAAVVE
ncbi:MAG: DUF1573 domain-containing protein [Candidatus Andersenbacteria bacterium]|nr:DUF1573 domain-containing protein [bacterium]MDZ4225485.1 DUF1573 domain-containing protein [Candidatus Andersenbacteria bacterium]